MLALAPTAGERTRLHVRSPWIRAAHSSENCDATQRMTLNNTCTKSRVCNRQTLSRAGVCAAFRTPCSLWSGSVLLPISGSERFSTREKKAGFRLMIFLYRCALPNLGARNFCYRPYVVCNDHAVTCNAVILHVSPYLHFIFFQHLHDHTVAGPKSIIWLLHWNDSGFSKQGGLWTIHNAYSPLVDVKVCTIMRW